MTEKLRFLMTANTRHWTNNSRLDFRQINHIQELVKRRLCQLQNPRMMRKENWLDLG
jgi:hypothetical protein